jgi:very-short-patch-repair endonuclease
MNHRIIIHHALHQQMVICARKFRKTPTSSEQVLWQALRGRQLKGLKFRRQQPIGPFIVDFFCPVHDLIVEVDGPIHNQQRAHDAERQYLLEQCGYRVIRFSAQSVEKQLPQVIEQLELELELPPHPPTPSPSGGEGEQQDLKDRGFLPSPLEGEGPGMRGSNP